MERSEGDGVRKRDKTKQVDSIFSEVPGPITLEATEEKLGEPRWADMCGPSERMPANS